MAGTASFRKAAFPVRDGNNAIILPVPPVDFYASQRASGTTAARPGSPGPRQRYYDTDLQETVYYNRDRSRWEDFIGNLR